MKELSIVLTIIAILIGIVYDIKQNSKNTIIRDLHGSWYYAIRIISWIICLFYYYLIIFYFEYNLYNIVSTLLGLVFLAISETLLNKLYN